VLEPRLDSAPRGIGPDWYAFPSLWLEVPILEARKPGGQCRLGAVAGVDSLCHRQYLTERLTRLAGSVALGNARLLKRHGGVMVSSVTNEFMTAN
jgi:hypothetical protein